MLTGDLLLVRTVKKNINPKLIDAGSKRYLNYAEKIMNIVQVGFENESPRLNIDAEISDLCAAITDHKVIQGIAKIMLDRCEFDLAALQALLPVSPYELRIEAFSMSQTQGPLAYKVHSEWPTAQDIFEQLAEKYGCSVQVLRRFLYADRKDMQSISSIREFSKPQDLLNRYNMGLCQATVLRATKLDIRLKSPDPKMLRQLFRSIKFHRLMFSISQQKKDVLITLDGPQSLLTQSSRYGMQLANCLPMMPLFQCDWHVHAQLLWGKKRKFRKIFDITSESGLVSHYQKKGTWRSNAEIWFEERFLALESNWILEPGGPIHGEEQNMLVPDFCFRHGNVIVYMEIIGFWRKDYLVHRVRQCPKNMLLAVSRKLVSDKKKMSKELADQLVVFAEIIPAKTVLRKLNEFL